MLTSLSAATGANASPTTPSAGAVAKAKAKVGTVAAQVGVMQAQLAVAEAKLEALGVAVDTASEAYNGAMFNLQNAKAAANAAGRAAANARNQLGEARRDVGRLAAAAYRSGGADLSLAALMTSASPQDAVGAVSMLRVLASRQSGILDRMKAAKVVASVLDAQAGAALSAVTQAADAAAVARSAVEARVAEQATQVNALNAQITHLGQALAVATARSTQLSKARAAGLARAARAKAAAARARAHAPKGSGGSGAPGGSTGGRPQGTTAGAAAAIAFAKLQLGDPYQWGATGPGTWDCSGLTMRAWEAGGISLPHWSVAQWQQSTPVATADARPGDLVFYANDLSDFRTIHHVALYLGGGLMIGAPHTGAVVRISSIDEPGFFGFARP